MNAPKAPAHTEPRLTSLSHGGGCGCNCVDARPDGVRLQGV
jgi:hypothetical protein